MVDLYGENWVLVLFVSSLITWAFGLTPPLLIRFVFMKRRIKKIWAITIVAFLWIFNAFLFTTLKIALTGQGRPGGVWVVIAFVSYMILRKREKLQVGHEQPPVQSHQKTITKTDTHNNKESETASMNIQQTIVDEEKIYGLIADEIDSGSMDKGLWTRLFAECNGDEKQTRVLYIKQRAQRLLAAERNRFYPLKKQQFETVDGSKMHNNGSADTAPTVSNSKNTTDKMDPGVDQISTERQPTNSIERAKRPIDSQRPTQSESEIGSSQKTIDKSPSIGTNAPGRPAMDLRHETKAGIKGGSALIQKPPPDVKLKILTCSNCGTINIFLRSEIASKLECTKCNKLGFR